jgi:hypothetical protein
MTIEAPTFMFRLWERGQQHLAAGRYVAARSALQAAEAIAWRNRDAQSLARLYLPLLEARRLIRYHAAEGTVLICPPGASTQLEHELLGGFFAVESGTILLASPAGVGGSSRGANHRRGAGAGGRRAGGGQMPACRLAGSVQYESRRSGRWLEALLLIQKGDQVRLASQADATFAAGLPVRWTQSDNESIGESTDPDLVVPLPKPGRYQRAEERSAGVGPPERGREGGEGGDGGESRLHALARESLIVAWEALALRWQHRHPPPPCAHAGHSRLRDPLDAAWQEMAWLRLALRVDPACEPVTMRLIALAEAVERM